MNRSWWQRRTAAQIGWMQVGVIAVFGVVLPVLIRTDQRPLILPAFASMGLVLSWVTGAGGVGGWAQNKLLRQAYREMRIPPGADVERWRPFLVACIAQHDPRWSFIVGVWAGVVASLAIPAAFRLPLWWCGIGLAAVAVIVLLARLPSTTTGGRPPLDDLRFLLTQLDANDGIRDP